VVEKNLRFFEHLEIEDFQCPKREVFEDPKNQSFQKTHGFLMPQKIEDFLREFLEDSRLNMKMEHIFAL